VAAAPAMTLADKRSTPLFVVIGIKDAYHMNL
jgi:hypothetical protein